MDGKKVALVTGAESGIGAACAVALAGAGYHVAICFHSDSGKAAASLAAVRAAGGDGTTIPLDVADEAAVEAAFDRAGAFGPVSVLVNSAGLNQSGVTVAEMSLAQWGRLIATDLTGAFLTSRRFVRDRLAAGGPGRIVNISSIHSDAVRAGAADYCAAKGGLLRLTQTMALECAAAGITVNAIAPGMILTPMNGRAVADAAYRQSLERNVPAGRAGRAEEVAAAMLYLVSDAAAYVTGANLVIDGGLSLLMAQGA